MHSKNQEQLLSEVAAKSRTQPRLPWRSRLVRDLAWSIGSPPLVCPDEPATVWPGADWYRQQLDNFSDELDSLDADAQAREDAFSRGRDQRLGTYFETLLALWLQRDPGYELLVRNLAVRRPRRGGGRETLGELDMLVMNHLVGRVEHWEVAVKFYLGKLPGTEDAPGQAWVGPGLKDRLDIKVARLLDHQLALPRHARTLAMLDERGLAVQASRVIMKGRLFYPLGAPLKPPATAAPEHLRGWWLRISEFPGPFAGRDWSWRCLTRSEWLAPVEDSATTSPLSQGGSGFAKSDEIRAATWPRMVVGLAEGREVTRGFLVPDDWGVRRQSPDTPGPSHVLVS